MRLLAASIFSILFALPAFPQITISGEADPDFAGREIDLYTIDDFLTWKQTKVASAPIDAEGRFELTHNLARTTLALLYIGETGAYIYLSPNENPSIYFPAFRSQAKVIMSKQKIVQLEFREDVAVNRDILTINEQVDDFVAGEFHRFLKRQARPLVDSFLRENEQFCDNATDPYVSDYWRYNCGILRLNSGVNRAGVFETYLDSLPILYHNDAYMSFLEQFFDGTFQNISLTKKGEVLNRAISTFHDRTMVLDVLKDEKFLVDPEMRELIAIRELYAGYYASDYNASNVLYVLKDFTLESPYPHLREIAQRMFDDIRHLAVGTPAPTFSAFTPEGGQMNLSDLNSKAVVVQFWAPWCTTCRTDMIKLAEYKKKYGDSVEFLSVLITGDSTDIHSVTRREGYDWNFVLDSDRMNNARQQYDVRAVPTYYLITAEGNLDLSPVDDLGTQLEKKLYTIDKTNFPVKYQRQIIIEGGR